MNTPKKTTLEQMTDTAWRMNRGTGKVRIYETRKPSDPKPRYEIRWSINKKLQRRYRSDWNKTIEEAKHIVHALDESRDDATLTTTCKIAYWKALEEKLGDVSLDVAVEYYLQMHQCADVAVDQCYKEFYSDCLRRGLSKRHLETLKLVVGSFAKHFTLRKVGSIKTEEIEDYVFRSGWAPRTQENRLRGVQRFFQWCQKKRYLSQSVSTEAHAVEPPSIPAHDPEVFTPEELQTIFARCDMDYLAYFAIAAFGGARRAEISRLTYEDIDWEQNVIHLSSAVTKTKRRRTLDLCPALQAWLSLVKERQGPIVPILDPLTIMRERLPKGFWKQNGLRHSFASYHLAKHRNAGLTAELAGHSVAILQTVYKQLVAPSAAEQWFAVTPESNLKFCLDREIKRSY